MPNIQLPSVSAPVVDQSGLITKVWRSLLQSIVTQTNATSGTAQDPEVVALGSSPFAYTAPADGFLIIAGNGVAAVAINRGQTGYVSTGRNYGSFPLKEDDIVRITYPSGTPKLTFFAG